ncbi:hypothetical protein F4819DRAFT_465758 [Hypoxylon fuscum]|nr:hypothetical protein F4819DRAFT_465758 [Hypoxylon fuscum]
MACVHLLVHIVCLFGTITATSLPKDYTTDNTHLGTFSDPAVRVRPRYRYWLPDASVNTQYLAEDIAELGVRGAGGIQFLNYYNYGGLFGTPATDWNIYGYGTPAYREVLKAALQAHKDQGLVMDFAMSPQSGQGVPAEPDNPGLSWNLISYNATILNNTYNGQVPGWGRGDLVSVVTFAVYNSTNKTVPPASVISDEYNYTEYLTSSESIAEVTSLVQEDGFIKVTVNPVEGAIFYLIYASYAERSYARACVASSDNPQNILQNGSFAVDHYSKTGSAVTIDFLEKYILIDGIKELMMEVGNYVWEDSVEIPSYTYWTPDLEKIFQKEHNYSITKYLMLLAGNEGDLASAGGPVRFVTDSKDEGAGVIADFRSTLSMGFTSYLTNLNNWTQQFLGLQFSQQPGYNLPVDMLQVIPTVDAPETETLSFSNDVDAFRQFCGPANLAGKPVISIELGADYSRTYFQTWNDILNEANRAFVTGVNQVSMHGATYSHTYPNTTWPGFTSFQYLFSGQHSRHQPAWDVGYKQGNDYLSRVQFVLRSGTPRVDLVFWDKQTAQNAYPSSLYQSDDLVHRGYAYTYLSPENFELDDAYVEDGVLAPQRQQFKALIIRANDTMTINGIRHLETYANTGFPIIISGGLPSTFASKDEENIRSSTEVLQRVLDLENVHQVPDDTFAEFLGTIGVHPRTQVDSNGTWYTRWVEAENKDVYVLVFNDANDSTGNIAFATTGTPYLLNPWTGDQAPIFEYSVEGGKTVVPFELKSNETRILLFSQCEQTNSGVHVVRSEGSVLGWDVDESSGEAWAKVASANSPTSLSLSSGEMVTVTTEEYASSSFSLSNWTVTVEQWLPPDDIFDIEVVANKSNATTTVPGSFLTSWSDLNLSTASGIAFYTSQFTWSSGLNDTGAYLVVPPVEQGIVGLVNGKEVPPMDITNPRADVTRLLVDGINTVSLKISSTLWDSILPIWSTLLTGGLGPQSPAEIGHSQNGIIGEVKVVPYRSIRVK